MGSGIAESTTLFFLLTFISFLHATYLIFEKRTQDTENFFL